MRLPRRFFVRPLPLLLLSRQHFFLPVASWVQPLPSHRKPTSQVFSSDSSSGATEGDQNQWEKMYQVGQARRNILDAMMNPESIPSSSENLVSEINISPVRVVTFDLDNTLWNTGATIGAANDVLSQFLNENNIVQSKRTEKIMGDLFQASKLTYCPLASENDLDLLKSPILLTRLRKDALKQILMEDNNYSEIDAEEFADKAFDTWMAARYAAIPSNYASNVVSVLDRIANLRDETSPILIGAITDGNSDPRNVPELCPYFDFCINAEQVGVAKPDQRVYQKAIDYVLQHPTLADLSGWEEAGPWWIHIGDDFSKDIVAAKNLNMRTVWAQELILDKLEKTKESIAAQYGPGDDNGDAQSENVSAEKELMDFQGKINSQSVVPMYVGAEDYLIASIQEEFADAVIEDFSELPNVLQKWHDQSQIQRQAPLEVSEAPAKVPGGVYVPEEADLVRDLIQKTPPATKFCVFCGAKIPTAAAFCSSCGEKQPDLQ